MATNFYALKEIFSKLEKDLLSLNPLFNHKQYSGSLDKNVNLATHAKNFLDSAWYVISNIKGLIDNEFSVWSVTSFFTQIKKFQSYAKYLSRYSVDNEGISFKAFYITDEDTFNAGTLIFNAIQNSLTCIDDTLDVQGVNVASLLQNASDMLGKRLALYNAFKPLKEKYKALVEFINDEDSITEEVTNSCNSRLIPLGNLRDRVNSVQITETMTQEEIESSIKELNQISIQRNEEEEVFLSNINSRRVQLLELQEVGQQRFINIINIHDNKDEAIKKCHELLISRDAQDSNPVIDGLTQIRTIRVAYKNISDKIEEKISALTALKTSPLEKFKQELATAEVERQNLMEQNIQLEDDIKNINLQKSSLPLDNLNSLVDKFSFFVNIDQIPMQTFELGEEENQKVNSILNTAISNKSMSILGFKEGMYITQNNAIKIVTIVTDFFEKKECILDNEKMEKSNKRDEIEQKLESTNDKIESIREHILMLENEEDLKKQRDNEAKLRLLDDLRNKESKLQNNKNIIKPNDDYSRSSLMFFSRTDSPANIIDGITSMDMALELDKEITETKERIRVLESSLYNELSFEYFDFDKKNEKTAAFHQFKGFYIFNIFFSLEYFKIFNCIPPVAKAIRQMEYISRLETAARQVFEDENPVAGKYQELKNLIAEGLSDFPKEATQESLHAQLISYQQKLEAIFPEDFTPPQSAETDPHNSAASSPTQSRS